MTFQKGDLVTGTSGNTYTYTNKDSVCEVLWIEDIYMEVKILEQPKYSDEIGRTYTVRQSSFKKIEPNYIQTIKENYNI